MNTVIRKCLKCQFEGEEEKDFIYLGDCVWQCHNCQWKYTEVVKIIPKQTANEA